MSAKEARTFCMVARTTIRSVSLDPIEETCQLGGRNGFSQMRGGDDVAPRHPGQ